MSSKGTTEVLLAVAEASEDGAASGGEVGSVLAGHRSGRLRSDRLLARLLELEAADLVHVERNGGFGFRLTRAGERAAAEAGGGKVTDLVLVMVDLVGFVAFTDRHGDAEAHRAAQGLTSAATAALSPLGGRVVKATGDGFIGAAPARTDLVAPAQEVAGRVAQPDGSPWPMRAAVHDGSPIEHRDDLFGRDVNLVARLCDAAGPGELLHTTDPDDDGAERLAVRGLDEAVTVRRVALR